MASTEVGVLSGAAVMVPSYSFTRPSNTTQYATGQLMANSVTAGSVVVPSFSNFSRTGSFYPVAVVMQKSATSTTSAQFRVHLYSVAPTIATTGDGGVYNSVVTGNAGWIGSYDGTMQASHADGASVTCVPTEGLIDPFATGQNPTIYALIEVRSTYTPASAETITLRLVLENN